MYNDNYLSIDWKLKENALKLSEKDIKLPKFDEAEYFNESIKLYE